MDIFKHTIPITAIIENNGQFLFIKRSRNAKNMAGKWVFPGGKIEKGEDAIQALFRELYEETKLQFYDDVAFLSSYKFIRNEDGSSSLGLVFLVKSINRDVYTDESVEEHRWIDPLDITKFTFSYKEITDFDSEKYVTIPGMEVHVRNAIIALRKDLFINRHLLSVTEYQNQKCSMSEDYLYQISNNNNLNDFIEKNIFPKD